MDDERVEMSVLGKVVCTATGWDQQDTFALIFYNAELNDLGNRFVPSLNGRTSDLMIDFERGVVATYDDEGNETVHKSDWSVFNV